MTDGSSPNRPGPFSLPQILPRLWIAAFLLFFAAQTLPVRLANSDDVRFDRASSGGTLFQYSWSMARAEGRFYMPFADAARSVLYSIRQPILFALLRTAILAWAIWAVADLFEQAFQIAGLRLLVATGLLLTLQIPLCFYGILSSPQFAIGLAVTCAFLGRIMGGKDRPASFVVCGLGVLLAACLNECFVLPLAIGTAWAALRPRLRPAAALSATALCAYALAYAVFRQAHPSAYAGTQFSPKPLAAFRCAWRNLGATLPGFELVINRPGWISGPLFKPAAEIRGILAETPPVAIVLLLLGIASFLAQLLRMSRSRLSIVPGRFSLLAFLALSFVAAMALTTKYQVWASQRQYPYYYAMGSWSFGTGLAITALAAIFSRRRIRSATGPWLVGAALASASLSVAASNARVLKLLARHPYPLVKVERPGGERG